MVKKQDSTEGKIIAVEEALGRTEQFIEKNQKIIFIVLGSIMIIVLGYFGIKQFYLKPQEAKAHAEMFYAEKYFEIDSLDLALNGDGQHIGFLEVIDNYSITKASNLAKYYCGIIYLKKGKYDDAIKYLKDFSSDDQIVGSLATAAIGDAYLELNDKDKALEYYLKAAEKNKNNFSTPQCLMKAGFVYEDKGDWGNALKTYEKIKKEYFKSQESREIDKYIAKAKGMLNQ
ncbi:MAG: tetratricopeptide repeat protein [Bacteroidetes bacterium]|nr:tetratricopeptide repeat protein [Bacteroidota bacterium]